MESNILEEGMSFLYSKTINVDKADTEVKAEREGRVRVCKEQRTPKA